MGGAGSPIEEYTLHFKEGGRAILRLGFSKKDLSRTGHLGSFEEMLRPVSCHPFLDTGFFSHPTDYIAELQRHVLLG